MTITRPVNEGESQTIRIPTEYRFEDEDLVINRVGDSLMITPRRALASAFFSGAAMLDEDFMADGRPDEVPTVREVAGYVYEEAAGRDFQPCGGILP